MQIQQVVMNLVLNAVRAVADLPGGNRQVRIATSGTPDGASIVVEDSGPGVPEDIAPRIFEPFVSTKDAGLGMGLAISRRIVETHGGGIKLATGSLGGARFEVALPVEIREEKVAAHA